MFFFKECIILFAVLNFISALSPSLKKEFADWKNPSSVEDTNSHSWDFEFEDKQVQQEGAEADKETKVTEIVSESELCRNLQCKPHQVCLVEDDDVAVCISKRKFASKENSLKVKPTKKAKSKDSKKAPRDKKESQDKDKKENPCIPCPVLKPDFVCGTDNHTYSSVCRLEFRNCMHKANVAVSCKGFCPCKITKNVVDKSKEFQMKDRWNRYMSKYQNTVKKPSMMPKQKHSLGKPGKTYNSSNKKDLVAMNTSSTQKPTFKGIQGIKSAGPIIEKSCNELELKAMGDRLLDWFSVVMADHRRGSSRRRSFRLSHTELPECKAEVGWMFQHLDADGDLKLSARELADLEGDERERCLRPYLLDCDRDNDRALAPHEWCACFDKSQRPCAAALRRVPQGLIGGYTPVCDGEGYYSATQCHTGSGTCWCVDRHGVEFTNTRRRGRPDCEGLLKKSQYQLEHPQETDQEDDSNEEEGSADRPLDF